MISSVINVRRYDSLNKFLFLVFELKPQNKYLKTKIVSICHKGALKTLCLRFESCHADQ